MVKITNGCDYYIVPQGAFEGIFQRRGFWLADIEANPGVKDCDLLSGKERAELNKISKDEIWALKQCEKPLSAWNQRDIKRFARIRGLNLAGIHSIKEAREFIAKNI